MNFNLSKDKKKSSTKSASGLLMGLNARGNVFGGGDGSSDDEDNNNNNNNNNSSSKTASSIANSATARVNRALLREQDLLRKRAEAAAAAIVSTEQEDIYNYDAAYDSFHDKNNKQSNQQQQQQQQQRSSRYIGDLLKAAKQRQYERDIVYERKIAKEQALEEEQEENADYQQKEKFVTAAYKRKLEERRLWLEQEEKKRKTEEADDVTKKTGGMAMARFYGNLNRNVAMGGGEEEAEAAEIEKTPQQPLHDTHHDKSAKNELSFLDGFELATDQKTEPQPSQIQVADEEATDGRENKKGPVLTSIRGIREKKVAEARLRYFKRHNLISTTS